MPTRRRVLRLRAHEHEALKQQYVAWGIPIDQFEARPDELRDFADDFNTLTGRTDSAGDILHYMRTQRKLANWIKLGKNAKPSPPKPSLSAEETEVLVAI